MADLHVKRVRVGSLELAYVESGVGEPLILIHGREGHKNQYRVFLPLLGSGIRGISYDQRDTCDTVNDESEYTIGMLADDCAGFILALGFEKAHVFGISLGGGIAVNLAINHPEQVQSLIIGSTAPKSSGASVITEKAKTMSSEERTQFLLDSVISPEGQRDPGLMDDVRAALCQREPAAAARRAAAIGTHDVISTTVDIKAPTLILHGSDDPVINPEFATWFAERIPNSHLEMLPGLRHGISFEGRERTAQLVRDWVLSHPLGG